MSLDQIANTAEIFAAILVIVSLVYVGVQVKQNTSALRLGTAHNTFTDFTDIYALIASQEGLASIVQRGLMDYDSLESVEKLRFYMYFHKFFRAYENAYYQYKGGALEQEPFEGLTQQLLMISSLPGTTRYWIDRKSWFNHEFQSFVDGMLVDNKSTFELAGTE